MDLQHVKLSNLCIGPEIDSRGGKAPVDDLIESIKARGLIQPLAVRATGEEDEYEIIAGHRRFEALRIIHGKKDPAVPCVVLAPGDDAEALELSTMENVLRKPLHPVEEYDAYARLVAQGVTVFEIAKRFGKTERWVRQRLQLGRLSPLLRDAWRKGEISTEQAAAFSCSADHARQESVWAIIQKAYGDYTKRPDAIRSELEDKGYGSDDARVAIIGGIEAYKAAGGRLTEDLFVEFQTLVDGEIVDKLVAEKLEARCAELRAEGWSFATVQVDYDYRDEIDLRPWMTAEERAVDESDGLLDEQVEAVRERAKADPAARAQSGVILSLGHEGIEYEFLMEPKAPEPERQGAGEDDGEQDKPEPGKPDPKPKADPEPPVNHPLVQAMSEQLTLALSDVIATEPGAAICALAASLELALDHGSSDALFRLTANPWEATKGVRIGGVTVEKGPGKKFLPGGQRWTETFLRYRAMDAATLQAEMGRMAAKLFDARVIRFDSSRPSNFDNARKPQLKAIAAALPPEKLNAAIDKHFDRDGYFRKLTIAGITETLGKMGRKDGIPKDKAGLVKLAAQVAKEKGWLPPEMRLPGVEKIGAASAPPAAAPKAKSKSTRKGK